MTAQRKFSFRRSFLAHPPRRSRVRFVPQPLSIEVISSFFILSFLLWLLLALLFFICRHFFAVVRSVPLKFGRIFLYFLSLFLLAVHLFCTVGITLFLLAFLALLYMIFTFRILFDILFFCF